MRKTFQMMIAAGALGLPMLAAAGPDHNHDECPADCVSECCVDLAELTEFEFKAPSVMVGDTAPKMEIAQFVKGESMDAFEEGKVYVVEFWATWCGPCVAAFPHISEVQAHYGDKLQVVGVNIWDREQDRETKEFKESQGDWVQRITDFVDEQGDNMSYTVALEQDTKMAENWMIAAGRGGIPSAFIVDGSGTIAWMGHPMDIDDTLEAVIEGEFDLEAAATEAKEGLTDKRDEQLLRHVYEITMKGILSEDEGESAKGYETARAFVKQIASENAQILNGLAWRVIDPATTITHPNFEFAAEVGLQAAEVTKFEDPMILDTYALALFKTGEVKKAIKIQKKAIKLVGDSEQFSNYLSEFEDRLEEFEAEG